MTEMGVGCTLPNGGQRTFAGVRSVHFARVQPSIREQGADCPPRACLEGGRILACLSGGAAGRRSLFARQIHSGTTDPATMSNWATWLMARCDAVMSCLQDLNSSHPQCAFDTTQIMSSWPSTSSSMAGRSTLRGPRTSMTFRSRSKVFRGPSSLPMTSSCPSTSLSRTGLVTRCV